MNVSYSRKKYIKATLKILDQIVSMIKCNVIGVTLNANHAQKRVFQQIMEKKRNAFIPLKNNRAKKDRNVYLEIKK